MSRRTLPPRLAALAGAACCALSAAAAVAQPERTLPRPASSDTVTILVAATTDVHGRVRAWDYAAARPDSTYSLAAAATIVDSLRSAAPGRVLLVDAGDLLQGNPFAHVASRVIPASEPHPIIAAMNAMRYDAAAVGNHEFNFGLANLRRAVAQARFPFLAANARRPDGARAFPAYRIVERAGVKVGIVGGTTPGATVWDRDNLRGRLVLRDLVPAMAEAVTAARQAGADVIVAVMHSGLDGASGYDTVTTGVPSENVAARVAREVPGVDAIVFGHSHGEVVDSTIGGVLVVQPRNWAASVAVARLAVVRRDKGWAVAGARGESIPVLGRRESAAVLAATRAGHARAVRYVNAPLGTTPVAWRGDSARVSDGPLTDFMLEVMRRRAGAELAATAAFSLDARLDAGAITRAQIARLYPYANTLRAVRVTGAQLRAYLEQTARYFGAYPGDAPLTPRFPGYNYDLVAGVDYTVDISRPAGERITRLDYRGRAVTDADRFTLAINSYRHVGGGGYAMFADAPVVYDRGEDIADLLAEEVARRGVLRPDDYYRRNWELAPAAAGARAYAAMRPARLATERGAPATPAVPKAATPRPLGASTRPARLRVLGINDFHGALEPRPDRFGVRRGGAGPLAAEIARARAECEPPHCVSILLDGGDELQGTPASNLAYGRPVVALFRELDVSAAALGNHEFDWGVDTLRARMAEAPYAILGANVRAADGSRLDWVRQDTLIERAGLRIGVVGVADPATPRTTRALNVRGLRFDPPAPAIDERARALRDRGADVVIVVAHLGAFCDADRDNDPGSGAAAAPTAGAPADSAPRACAGEIVELAGALTERVDAIVSGHTHSRVATVLHGIPVVQGRRSGRGLGVVDIDLTARAGSGSVGGRVEMREVVADSAGPVPPRVDAIVRRAADDVAARVGRRVGAAAGALPREPDEQYALGNLVADAQRWAGRGDVAIMNNGGIRTGLDAGAVTFGALYEVQPFGNTLYRLEVRGRDLRAHLARLVARDRPRWHVSGVTLTYDPTREGADRLRSATLADGRRIADDETYSVIINDFLVTGGDGLALAEVAVASADTRVVDVDALADYLATLPQPFRAPDEVRIRPAEARP